MRFVRPVFLKPLKKTGNFPVAEFVKQNLKG